MKKLVLALAAIAAICIVSCDKNKTTGSESASVESASVSVDTTMVSASATVDTAAVKE